MVSRPWRIMPLGDSITESAKGQYSYRFFLQNLLRNAGVTFDFVGSLNGVHGGPPRNLAFDANHEGHWGGRTDEVLAQLPTWVKNSQPDVVLVHLGTNDLFQGQEAQNALDDLKQVVKVLQQNNSETRIVIAQILPWKDGIEHPERVRYNRALATWVEEAKLQGAHMALADCNTGFDPDSDTWDGYHPNSQGEQKMAEQWMIALTPLLKNAKNAP